MEYRLANTLSGLSNDNLKAEPHPAEFREAQEQIVKLDGMLLEIGFPSAIWHYEDQILSATQWDQLMGFLGGDASKQVYIRTRTNNISAGEYEFKCFKAIMHRPTGESKWGYRFEEVSLEFSHLEVETCP